MQSKSSERLKITTFKLNSLLSITQAINENLPTCDLLNHYETILKEDLNIGKVLIYKYSNKWECILSSGFPETIHEKIKVERDLVPVSYTHLSLEYMNF